MEDNSRLTTKTQAWM